MVRPIRDMQEQADDHEEGADDRKHLVATPAADQLARPDGGQQQPAHERQQPQSRPVGLSPRASWKKMGRKVRAPNMANPTTKPTALAAENTRLANSPRGITGSAARRSTTRNSDRQHDPGHRQGDDRRRPPRDRSSRPGS